MKKRKDFFSIQKMLSNRRRSDHGFSRHHSDHHARNISDARTSRRFDEARDVDRVPKYLSTTSLLLQRGNKVIQWWKLEDTIRIRSSREHHQKWDTLKSRTTS